MKPSNHSILLYPLNNPIKPQSGLITVEGWVYIKGSAKPQKIIVRNNKEQTYYSPEFKGLGEDSNEFHFGVQVRLAPGLKRLNIDAQLSDGSIIHLGNRWVKIGSAPVYDLQKITAYDNQESYKQWIEDFEPSTYLSQPKDLKPSTSTITFFIQTDSAHQIEAILETIRSLRVQSDANWRCIIVDSGGITSGFLHRSIRKELRKDQRILFHDEPCNEQGYIPAAKALNHAIKKQNEGWIGFLEAGDFLRFDAVAALRAFITDNPKSRVFYTDNDFLDEENNRVSPQIKPELNPDYLLSSNYIGPSYLVHSSVFEEVDAFDKSTGSFYHWDLQLRLSEHFSSIEFSRIPGVYFHLSRNWKWDPSGNENREFETVVLKKCFERRKIPETYFEPMERTRSWRIKFPLPEDSQLPKVTIMIPTRDGLEYLSKCIRSIEEKTDYPNYELMVLDNDSEEAPTLEYFKRIEQQGIKVIHCPGHFNYSAICNRGETYATGEIIGFLNDDIEIIERGWLKELVSQCLRPEVGAVGCRLLYPDDKIQHAGVILGVGHVGADAFRFTPNTATEKDLRAFVLQNYTALSGACLFMRKSVYDGIDGFNEELEVTNNDVEICLRIREQGLRNVYTPFPELYHHESVSRGSDNTPERLPRYQSEVDYMWKHWENTLTFDPNYNPLLTRFKEDFSFTSEEEQQKFRKLALFEPFSV